MDIYILIPLVMDSGTPGSWNVLLWSKDGLERFLIFFRIDAFTVYFGLNNFSWYCWRHLFSQVCNIG